MLPSSAVNNSAAPATIRASFNTCDLAASGFLDVARHAGNERQRAAVRESDGAQSDASEQCVMADAFHHAAKGTPGADDGWGSPGKPQTVVRLAARRLRGGVNRGARE